jgi:exopolysaccharide production protein ExoY
MKRGPEYLASESKRRLDIIGTIGLALALTPLSIPATVIAEVDTRSLNPFFKHGRVGKDSKQFDMLKLRSLRKASAELPNGTNFDFGAADPRATILGRSLRKTGLDEVPQLLNVIKGDMSLVGIRPLTQAQLERFEDIDDVLFNEWHDGYLSTNPGLVGPGQLYRRPYKVHDNAIYEESMRRDLGYMEHASVTTDLKILGSVPVKVLVASIRSIDNTPKTEELLVSPAA